MANDATLPDDERARYQNEQKLWVQIADENDAHDKAERDRFTWRWSAADPK